MPKPEKYPIRNLAIGESWQHTITVGGPAAMRAAYVERSRIAAAVQARRRSSTAKYTVKTDGGAGGIVVTVTRVA